MTALALSPRTAQADHQALFDTDLVQRQAALHAYRSASASAVTKPLGTLAAMALVAMLPAAGAAFIIDAFSPTGTPLAWWHLPVALYAAFLALTVAAVGATVLAERRGAPHWEAYATLTDTALTRLQRFIAVDLAVTCGITLTPQVLASLAPRLHTDDSGTRLLATYAHPLTPVTVQVLDSPLAYRLT